MDNSNDVQAESNVMYSSCLLPFTYNNHWMRLKSPCMNHPRRFIHISVYFIYLFHFAAQCCIRGSFGGSGEGRGTKSSKLEPKIDAVWKGNMPISVLMKGQQI